MRHDQILRVVTKDQEAVIVAVDATQLVNESMQRLNAWPSSMIHLGQALLGSQLLNALPDRDSTERIELQWRVDGVFGNFFSECRESFKSRGTILETQVDAHHLNSKYGEGIFQVRRVKQTASTGIVKSKGRVTEDLLEYLEQSEQKNCGINLWVDFAVDETQKNPFLVRNALGYLVHVLPQKTEAQMNNALYRWDQHLQSLGHLNKWVLSESPCLDIVSYVSAELKPAISLQGNPSFFCTCNEDRADRALAIVEHAEKEDGVDLSKGTHSEVRCEFCGKIYQLENHPKVVK